VALAVAKLTQQSVPDANANNEALSATQSAAIGATEIVVTFGGAVTADFYKDGIFYVNDATGEGYMYRVKGHAAGTANVTIYLKDPIRVALVASTSEWSMIQNRQKGVIICPTTLTAPPAGVPPIAVTANYFFWNQVKGPCVVLTDGTLAIGEEVAPSNGTAGSVEALVHATTFDTTVGTVAGLNASTEYSLINLAIPGY
jgi:hypothetical protein